jgi:2-dehydro-3-deoxygluconokinase
MVELAPAGEDLFRRGFAGDTFNTAWYLRRTLPESFSVDYATCVGDDDLSERMRGFIAEAGVGVASIRVAPGRTVGLYMISLRDGERSFTYWRSASAARLLAADPAWLAAQLRGARLVLFSGITVAIVPPEDRPALFAALAEARAAGTIVAFDPNIRMRLWPDAAAARDGLTAAAAVSDVLLPSFEDEAALFGDADPAATLARYRALGARTVVVKNGPGEMLAWDADEGQATFAPAPITVVDTTAAGDSFNAACLAARLQGAPLGEAIAAGSRLAGKVCQSPGALVQPMTPRAS